MQRKIRFRTIGIVLTAMLCLNPVYGQKKKKNKELESEGIIFLEKDSSGGLWRETIASFVITTFLDKKGHFFDIYVDWGGNIKYTLIKRCLIMNRYYAKRQTIGNEYIYMCDNGYPEGEYIVGKYFKTKGRSIIFKKKVLTGEYWVKSLSGKMLYKTKFRQGTGYWKDYYYEEGTIREEGQVTRHYKTGEWKYYNKSGGIDSIKTYTVRDSVDVRFPYCLFNKTDRCW